MNALTDNFNAQAHWSVFIAPLLILLILDDINRRNRKKRETLDDQFRHFATESQQKERRQYQRQIHARCPAPRYRVPSPSF